MNHRNELRPSVMTSSSIRELSDLFDEIPTVSGVGLFDLMVLRDIDLESIRGDLQSGGPPPPNQAPAITEFLAEARNFELTRDWILTQCRHPGIEIAALASYFPDVTSLCGPRREMAIEALVSTVRVGLALNQQGLMRYPIIEMVGGTILDQCECDDCTREGMIYVYGREDKILLLCDSIGEVVSRVREREGDSAAAFALALEMEPGESYILNGTEPLEAVAQRLGLGGSHQHLATHVGFNLDIAHMRIAEISANQLHGLRGWFVHAHIADHPGMHTRDQVVGTWTEIERNGGGYFDYLKMLV